MSSTSLPDYDPDKLLDYEVFWRDHQRWLQESGYMLRPRYLPDWVPSWKTTNREAIDCEDSVALYYYQIIDATRISDNATVILKSIQKSVFPHEIEMATLFCAEPLAADPHNHCIPILETLQVPDDDDFAVIVMPLLTHLDHPLFDTIGEAVEFFRQTFEGIQFMHRHHVAHRDCNGRNLMMQANEIFPDGFHPQSVTMNRTYTKSVRHLTRTQYPPKYYIIDFGLSRRYNPDEGKPLEPRIFGGDKTVPEFQDSDGPFDPFPTDVYYLGNMIKWYFTEGDGSTRPGLYGFKFMKPLVDDMTQKDPMQRPTMDEVVERFEVIRKGLSSWKLRSRPAERSEHPILSAIRAVPHWRRRILFIIKRVPAVPTPKNVTLPYNPAP